VLTPAVRSCCSTQICSIACDREDVLFASVCSVVRYKFPSCSSSITCTQQLKHSHSCVSFSSFPLSATPGGRGPYLRHSCRCHLCDTHRAHASHRIFPKVQALMSTAAPGEHRRAIQHWVGWEALGWEASHRARWIQQISNCFVVHLQSTIKLVTQQ
jgi:hypothetical protein